MNIDPSDIIDFITRPEVITLSSAFAFSTAYVYRTHKRFSRNYDLSAILAKEIISEYNEIEKEYLKKGIAPPLKKPRMELRFLSSASKRLCKADSEEVEICYKSIYEYELKLLEGLGKSEADLFEHEEKRYARLYNFNKTLIDNKATYF